MAVEFLLPGSVMILKSLFRLAVDRHVNGVLFAKAILAFPVDLAFLSLSYALATIVSSGGRPILVNQSFLGMIMIYVVLGFLTTVTCSKSDRAFDAERNLVSVGLGVVSWVVGLAVLGFTVFGNFL